MEVRGRGRAAAYSGCRVPLPGRFEGSKNAALAGVLGRRLLEVFSHSLRGSVQPFDKRLAVMDITMADVVHRVRDTSAVTVDDVDGFTLVLLDVGDIVFVCNQNNLQIQRRKTRQE